MNCILFSPFFDLSETIPRINLTCLCSTQVGCGWMAVPIRIISSWPRNKQTPQLRVLLLLCPVRYTHHPPTTTLCRVFVAYRFRRLSLLQFIFSPTTTTTTNKARQQEVGFSKPASNSLLTHPSNRSADNTTRPPRFSKGVFGRESTIELWYTILPPPALLPPAQEWYLFRLTKTTLSYILIILIIVLGLSLT